LQKPHWLCPSSKVWSLSNDGTYMSFSNELNWFNAHFDMIDFDIGVSPMNDIAYLEAYMVA